MGMVNRAVNSFLPPFAEKGWAENLNRSLLETGKVIPTHRYQVHLNAQGEMEGQIFPLLIPEVFARKVGGTNILIHRDGEVVARTLSDESGRFIVKDLKPGHYGLVAAGVVGYAAFAFDAVEGDITTELSESTTPGNSLYTLVSTARSANAAETLIAAVSQGSILPVAPIPWYLAICSQPRWKVAPIAGCRSKRGAKLAAVSPVVVAPRVRVLGTAVVVVQLVAAWAGLGVSWAWPGWWVWPASTMAIRWSHSP
jgi:hypothetical protein